MIQAGRSRKECPIGALPYAVGPYILRELIGSGGSGFVFKAQHQTFPEEYAVKVIPIRDKSKFDSINRAFRSEVDLLSHLDSSNVIRIYDYFSEDNMLFLVLELCAKTVESIIVKGEGVAPNLLAPICKQIIDAIAFCHENGVAHRDIKPSNILLDKHGRVKVADFGQAMRLSKGELSSNFMGSYAYISPEIIRQEDYDPFKSDVFSLGVTLYTIATGKSLWPLDSVESLASAILSGIYPSIQTGNRELDKLIRRMVVLNPNKRITMKKAASKKLAGTIRLGESLPVLPKMRTSPSTEDLVQRDEYEANESAAESPTRLWKSCLSIKLSYPLVYGRQTHSRTKIFFPPSKRN